MKAIIFISSFFYLIGLFIGNKFELFRKSHPIEKIISYKINNLKPSGVIHFNDTEAKPEVKSKTDGKHADKVVLPLSDDDSKTDESSDKK